MNKLEEFVLGTFSFYEAMTFSQVILDLDAVALKDFPEFSKEDLEIVIKALIKKKLIKTVKIDKEEGWIRIHPKRAWWKWPFFL